ncbi:MAG: AAA family ATPase [Nanoarchaeota archaeon]
MEWYERFGLSKNPFTTDPFESEYTLVNYSQLVEDLLYFTAAGHMVLLEGSEGAGKTMMLQQIISRFRGEGRVAYIDGAHLRGEPDIEQILNKKGRGFLGNMMKKKPKGMILLLDDVVHISSKNFEKIKYYFDQDYIRSVIFTIHDSDQLDMPPSIIDRVQGRHIVIPPMNNFDALRIVRERFSDHFFLSDHVILKLFELSNRNIKQLLKNCDRVCEFVVQEGKGEVLPKYLRIALSVHGIETEENPISSQKVRTEVEVEE